jgi:hypothetical protein
MLFMHRVSQVVGVNLHEAQCGFRFGRGIVDAMFVMCQLLSATHCNKDTQLHFVFINLTKVYDWIIRQTLWHILRTYQVPSKIVNLLEDLHIGTLATIKLGANLGQEFFITSGVRQGRIVALLLFNVFLDFVIKHALDNMRLDSEASVQF